MTNSQHVCLGIIITLMTACVSDDEPTAPDAGVATCTVPADEIEARRLCTKSCAAAAGAIGCSADNLEEYDVACVESCIGTPIATGCVDEAARYWVCLAQQSWVCSPSEQKPAPMDGAGCILEGDVLGDCVRGGGA
jgi:hypothetical protein